MNHGDERPRQEDGGEHLDAFLDQAADTLMPAEFDMRDIQEPTPATREVFGEYVEVLTELSDRAETDSVYYNFQAGDGSGGKYGIEVHCEETVPSTATLRLNVQLGNDATVTFGCRLDKKGYWQFDLDDKDVARLPEAEAAVGFMVGEVTKNDPAAGDWLQKFSHTAITLSQSPVPQEDAPDMPRLAGDYLMMASANPPKDPKFARSIEYRAGGGEQLEAAGVLLERTGRKIFNQETMDAQSDGASGADGGYNRTFLAVKGEDGNQYAYRSDPEHGERLAVVNVGETEPLSGYDLNARLNELQSSGMGGPTERTMGAMNAALQAAIAPVGEQPRQ